MRKALVAVLAIILLAIAPASDAGWPNSGRKYPLSANPTVASINFLTGGTGLNCPSLASCIASTRASNATMFDSTGKLTYGPNNLLLNSASLSTQSVTAAVSNYVLFCQTASAGSIVLTGAATGTLTCSSGGANLAFAVTSAGTLTLTVAGLATNATLSQVTYETTQRPGDAVNTGASAYYGPRFDYTGGAAQGMLEEANATNVSGSVNNALLYSGVTFTANAAASPDGTTDAGSFVPTTANGTHYSRFLATLSAPTTASIWASAATYSHISMSSASSNNVFFNLTTCAVESTIGTGLASASASGPYTFGGNQYCHISIYQSTSTSWNSTYLFICNTATSSGNVNCASYAGDGTDGQYWFGLQVEAGSFPTSYIPTDGNPPVTRAADVPAATGAFASALAAGPSIWELKDEATGVVSRASYSAGSFAFPTAKWYRQACVYAPGTSAGYLSAHLTVGGPC